MGLNAARHVSVRLRMHAGCQGGYAHLVQRLLAPASLEFNHEVAC